MGGVVSGFAMIALYVPNSNGAPFIVAWIDVALILIPAIVIAGTGLLVKPRQNLLPMGIFAGILAWGLAITASAIVLFVGSLAAGILGRASDFEPFYPWVSWCFIIAAEIVVITGVLRSEYSTSP